MKDIYFATSNKKKAATLQIAVSEFGINVIRVPMDIPEPRSHDVREIAIEKIRYAFKNIKKPCVVQDSGFYITSLNGFPRAFVNFALETVGIDGILKLAEGKGKECRFRHCIAYMDDDLEEPKLFESVIKGQLAESPLGDIGEVGWSKLSTIFIPENMDRTLAELSKEEYWEWRRSWTDESEEVMFARFFKNRR